VFSPEPYTSIELMKAGEPQEWVYTFPETFDPNI